MTEPVAATAGARSLRVALTQWRATRDVSTNLGIAIACVDQAGRQEAEFVLLPENGLMLGTNAEMRAAALRLDSKEIGSLREAARRNRATVVLGGFKRLTPEGQVHNTALVIGAQGELAGCYDKIHMFNATVNGQTFAASNAETPGRAPAMAVVKGMKIGLSVCYDVRFPELFRRLALAGAEVFVVPSAFTHTTGKAHWEVLLRARAIENGAFLVASATIRGKAGGDAFETYGHALIVDPWGEVLMDLDEAEQACQVVEIDMDRVAEVRKSLPVLQSVSPESYAAPVQVFETTPRLAPPGVSAPLRAVRSE